MSDSKPAEISAEQFFHEKYGKFFIFKFAEAYASQRTAALEAQLAKSLHINYCEDLIEDGTPWEVPAEPEPSYFESLHEAVVFLVNLPDPEKVALEARVRELKEHFDLEHQQFNKAWNRAEKAEAEKAALEARVKELEADRDSWRRVSEKLEAKLS